MLNKILNFLLTTFLSICVISYWRGIWLLWDNLVFTDNPIASAVTSLLFGLFFLTVVEIIIIRVKTGKTVIQYTLAYPVRSDVDITDEDNNKI